jgi:hypothetical protein
MSPRDRWNDDELDSLAAEMRTGLRREARKRRALRRYINRRLDENGKVPWLTIFLALGGLIVPIIVAVIHGYFQLKAAIP